MKKSILFLCLAALASCKKEAINVADANNPAVGNLVDAKVTTVNSIPLVVKEMWDGTIQTNRAAHKATPHNAPSSWNQYARVNMGNNPGTFEAMTAWGQIYDDGSGSKANAPNTLVEMKDMEAWYLSKADNKWHLLQSSPNVSGAFFPESFSTTVVPYTRPYNNFIRDNHQCVSLDNVGYNFHFWPSTGRISLKNYLETPTSAPKDIRSDIKGVFITMQARLILKNLAGNDDRGSARYLLDVGGDYWQYFSSQHTTNTFNNVGDIGLSRFRYVNKQWEAYSMCTMSANDIKNNPPPIK